MSYKTFQGHALMEALLKAAIPTIKGWNRLEGRPRTEQFDRTLRAEVRDPLWMLTRQWQMGEFQGQDAGSPVFARVKVASTRLHRYQVKDHPPQAYDESIPLETRVEREEPPVDLPLALQIGRRWLRLLATALDAGELSRDYREDFKDVFFFELPERNEAGAEMYAYQEVWQRYAAVAGRSMNGGALYEKIRTGGDILEEITVASGDETKLRELADRLVAWIERLYRRPVNAADSAWAPSYLEYRFACSAPDYDGSGEIVLLADEYHRGHLDWYSFDVHPQRERLAPPEESLEPPEAATFDFIPTTVQFSGMPNTRWWEFEDRKTHFGDIDVHTNEIAKLLLIEFGLIYANDWFLLPYDLPVGSLARVQGLAVTNVFGERIWIEPSSEESWSMYRLNTRGSDGVHRAVFVPPAVDRLLESPPLEDVRMIRDEAANMVWGVEHRVPLLSGAPRDGYEAATERVNYLKSLIEAEEGEAEPPPEAEAPIRYVLMTEVPENWIPFIPVRIPEEASDNRQIQLQRAAMLRTLPGSEERPKILPRTALLRHNLGGAYYIHEEEVPRAGAQIVRTFQRARWHDGKVVVWLGRRKRTGRGPGSSGLAFDQIVPAKTD